MVEVKKIYYKLRNEVTKWKIESFRRKFSFCKGFNMIVAKEGKIEIGLITFLIMCVTLTV